MGSRNTSNAKLRVPGLSLKDGHQARATLAGLDLVYDGLICSAGQLEAHGAAAGTAKAK